MNQLSSLVILLIALLCFHINKAEAAYQQQQRQLDEDDGECDMPNGVSFGTELDANTKCNGNGGGLGFDYGFKMSGNCEDGTYTLSNQGSGVSGFCPSASSIEVTVTCLDGGKKANLEWTGEGPNLVAILAKAASDVMLFDGTGRNSIEVALPNEKKINNMEVCLQCEKCVPEVATPTMAPSEVTSTGSPTDASSTGSPADRSFTGSPTEGSSTGSPTEASSTASPTGSPTEASSTGSPSDEPSAVPSVAPSGAPTKAPVLVTSSPTEADTLTPTETLEVRVVTASPTEMEVEEEKASTGAPTETPTVVATDDPSSAPSAAPTEEELDTRAFDEECTDNPSSYEVMVDLHVEFEDGAPAECSAEAQEKIEKSISNAMQDAFPDRVPDWDGTADFGTFEFDEQQTFDDISRFRDLRQLRGRMLDAAKRLIANGRRRTDVLTCPLRGDRVCQTDYCLWGCVEAITTNCGTYDSTDLWSDMSVDIKLDLQDYIGVDGFECLGRDLTVDVTLEAGESHAPTASPTVTPGNPTKAPTDAPTPAPFPEFADAGEAVDITTKLQITYFAGQGDELDATSDVALQLIEELNIFIESILWQHEDYADLFTGTSEGSLVTSWDADSRILTLTFYTKVWFEAITDTVTQRDKAIAHQIVSKGDFHEFIRNLREHHCEHHVDQSECNKYMTGIQQIMFQGTGTGARL